MIYPRSMSSHLKKAMISTSKMKISKEEKFLLKGSQTLVISISFIKFSQNLVQLIKHTFFMITTVVQVEGLVLWNISEKKMSQKHYRHLFPLKERF